MLLFFTECNLTWNKGYKSIDNSHFNIIRQYSSESLLCVNDVQVTDSDIF